LFVWASADRGSEIYESGRDLKSAKRVTNLGEKLDGMLLGRSKIIKWFSDDGVETRGVLLLPTDYEPSRRYPLIVNVYPLDDQLDVINEFGMQETLSPFFNWQLFASRGYAVFFPNIPTRAKSKMVDIGRVVLPGIQRVIDLGVADPKRIGVTGTSAGGYSTLALLVQSGIFRAGVMVSGFGNLIDAYSYDFGRRVIEENWGFRTTPWEDRSIFIENSPYFYLNKVDAPLLIIAGSADPAVPPHLGEEVFSGLRRLGKEAVYVEYEGEGHSPEAYTPEHQLDICDRIFSWFDLYLKGKPTRQISPSGFSLNP